MELRCFTLREDLSGPCSRGSRVTDIRTSRAYPETVASCSRYDRHGGRGMCLAIPGKILSIEGVDLARNARVSFGGIVKEVGLAFVPEAKVGDYVIVHVGLAISLLDDEEALRTFDYLKQMDDLAELEP
jgi:hydrogenase expression/formation protein HypC